MINKSIYEIPVLYTNPVPKIAFGWGVYETVGDECKNAQIKKALIVTTGLKKTGIIEEIKTNLKNHGVAVEVYDKITSNPKNYQIMDAYRVFRDSQCDGIVAVGGGSSIDAAKGVRVVAANGGKEITGFAAFLDPPWMEQLKYTNSCTIPQISIPTTAGSGAGVTFWAVVKVNRTVLTKPQGVRL